MKRKRNRPDIQKLRHEVRILRKELEDKSKVIKNKEYELGVFVAKTIDKFTELLEDVKKQSDLLRKEAEKNKKKGFWKRLFNKIRGKK